MSRLHAIPTALALVLALTLAPSSRGDTDPLSIEQTAASASQDLQKSLQALSQLREQIAGEKLPLNRELARLENRLTELRGEFDEVRRTLDTRTLDLSTLRTEIEAREAEQKYLASLFDEYIRNFESRVHITELQRYEGQIDHVREVVEDGSLAPAEVFQTQVEMVDASLDRLIDLVGGSVFDGRAVDPDGRVKDVRFVLVGPVAFYSATDGSGAGLAEQRLGSLEPNMVGLEDPTFIPEIESLVASGKGVMPFDPTLGDAQKIDQTRETVYEEVQKGGLVMIPILLLAGAALLVALGKWAQLASVRAPSKKQVRGVLEAVQRGDQPAAAQATQRVRGPVGAMLAAGVDHLHEPKALVEEMMFEKMLETRLRLQSFLPFIAVSAAAAPLLGLLGTVTGIINTFKLITIFGTGDAKTLSSGISEALITTKFGLIVAIPSLLLHAFLSRKARRFTDGMEKTAVSLLNRIVPGRFEQPQEPRGPRDDAHGAARDEGNGKIRPKRSGVGSTVPTPAGVRASAVDGSAP